MSAYKDKWLEKYQELAMEKGLDSDAIDQEIAEQTDDYMGSIMYEQADHANEQAKDDLINEANRCKQ